jgi:hypothetical protein
LVVRVDIDSQFTEIFIVDEHIFFYRNNMKKIGLLENERTHPPLMTVSMEKN